jgi:hypothetical protein
MGFTITVSIGTHNGLGKRSVDLLTSQNGEEGANIWEIICQSAYYVSSVLLRAL